MTLQQLSNVKRWHQSHQRGHAVEYQVWDAILTCWLLGWVGMPAAVVLAPRAGLTACALLSCVPEIGAACCAATGSRVPRPDQVLGSVTPRWPWYLPPRSL
jgi:hypothetical protein